MGRSSPCWPHIMNQFVRWHEKEPPFIGEVHLLLAAHITGLPGTLPKFPAAHTFKGKKMIGGDMRRSGFRDRRFVYAEIRNLGHLPETQLIIHATRPEHPSGRVVRMSKETVKRLRKVSAWRRGFILLGLYFDRPEA